MKTNIRCAALSMVFATLMVAGCSTSMNVTELNPAATAGTEVKGIPFRTKDRYDVVLYKLEGGSYKQVNGNPSIATLANQDHLYLLAMNGGALSNGTVKVVINSDNTLSGVTVNGASQGQAALTELTSGLKTISDAKTTRNNAAVADQKAAETTTQTGEDARLSALDAEKDATLAQLTLEALPASATALERKTAELALTRARLVANQKARRAGLALPFPDAGT